MRGVSYFLGNPLRVGSIIRGGLLFEGVSYFLGNHLRGGGGGGVSIIRGVYYLRGYLLGEIWY